jgi:Ran GTPase-activating protein (RanGAP) involved in mRNA processing and transport
MCTLLTQNICLMCHTQVLRLGGNQIGDAGLTTLAKAVESGALAQLTRLDLDGNSIGATGMSALASACASGALDNLTILQIDSNKIGDNGISALATAITPGPSGKRALDHLTVCWRPTDLFPCFESWHTHPSD